MQAPSQSTSSRPVFFATYLPRFLSGPKIIFSSFGRLSTIATALVEVQTMSLMALISAVEFTYMITVWFGCCSLKTLNSSGGQVSAREQPAFRSGNNTFFFGDRIFRSEEHTSEL